MDEYIDKMVTAAVQIVYLAVLAESAFCNF